MRCLQTNNCCPCCRSILQEKNEVNSGYDSEMPELNTVSDSDSDSDEEEDDRDKEPFGCTIELLTQKLQEKGYTMLDIVSILFEKFSHIDPKYTEEHCDFICDDVNTIEEELNDEAYDQYDERKNMKKEDVIV
jgi:hypothetical protein